MHMRPYIKDDIELDQIGVHGIRVKGYHGVLDTEREGGQVFFADVIAHVNSRTAAARDNVAHTVNYSDMADRAAEVLAGSPGAPNHLIEAVAEKIARAVLEMGGVECVDVTVHKPHAPLHVEFKDVTVTIRRDLSDGGLWADKRIGSSAGESDDPLSTGGTPVRDQMDVRPAQPAGALIALGGNLDDVEPTFRAALTELHRVSGIEVQSVSPLVRTAPEGGVDQPDYLNAVVRVETTLAPRELLAACHGIEMLHGRDRSVPGSARTLDLDLISFDGVSGETSDLTLPHPRAHVRNFVLLPWSHMEPDAVLEPHGSVTDLARRAGLDGVQMVSTQWPRVPAPDALAGPNVPAAAVGGVTLGAGEPAPVAEQPAQPAPSQQSVAQPQSFQEVVPDRLSPYSPAPGVTQAPESPFVAQGSAAPELEPGPTVPSEPAPRPTWAPVQDSAPGTPSASAVPSFPAPSAPSQSQSQFVPDPQAQPSVSQPTEPQASESAPAPAHRPDGTDGTGTQPSVPRRTSFGVLRQQAESPDESN